MSSPKSQPITATPKKAKGRPRKPITGTALEKINPDPPEVQSARNLKDQLTAKELKFIEIYMLGGVTKEKAMELAGYTGYHQRWVYYLAAKIIQKFENQAGNHRKIARALGAGEVTILQGLRDIAQDPKVTAAVRLLAWAELASCLGLKGERSESFQGVSIIIMGEDDAQVQGIEGGPASDAKPSIPPKPIKITK